MDIKTYEFPKVTDLDLAFGTFDAIPELLKEAKDRGFYNGNSKYNRMFSQLFFKGGTLDFKENLDDDFKNKAVPYLKSFMGSFAPKHEEKEAICAMLLGELCE